jgi:hypothetical protein
MSVKAAPGNLGGLEDAEEMAVDATAGIPKTMLSDRRHEFGIIVI